MFSRYLLGFDSQKNKCLHSDFIVVGSGIAGMYTALNLSKHGSVLLMSKGRLVGGNTLYAQGGIAAALGPEDSPFAHLQDTINAGAGVCNKKVVKILVEEGPFHIKEIIKLGASFDRKGDKHALTKEGAHSYPRVLHARGDATGKEISQVLAQQILNARKINVMENIVAIDLITEKNRCTGIIALDTNDKPFAIQAKAIILATGGIGQLYQKTTNPPESTGDGIAMALRAGIKTVHLEFVQFHPTMLNHPQASGFLISEAVRGEGAILKNFTGEAFMKNYHKLADLSSRDIVARSIVMETHKTGKDIFLDATHLDKYYFAKRFPSIYQTCINIGLNPSKECIPVTPAAHYLMGGIETDTFGRTNLSGLYACGETACTGVHGANRLASNSLLEGLVFGYRTARAASLDNINTAIDIKKNKAFSSILTCTDKGKTTLSYDMQLRKMTQQYMGIIRNELGLQKNLEFLQELSFIHFASLNLREKIVLQNKVIVAYYMTKSALARRKSCGAHFRDDSNTNISKVMEVL